jgi:hypothetical protein
VANYRHDSLPFRPMTAPSLLMDQSLFGLSAMARRAWLIRLAMVTLAGPTVDRR